MTKSSVGSDSTAAAAAATPGCSILFVPCV